MAAEPAPHEVKSVDLRVVDKPPRRNPWRPTTLTIRKFLSICHRVENAWAITRACEFEGVSYRIFDSAFLIALSGRALQEAEATRFNLRHEQALESIMAAGERNWIAHACWLERNLIPEQIDRSREQKLRTTAIATKPIINIAKNFSEPFDRFDDWRRGGTRPPSP